MGCLSRFDVPPSDIRYFPLQVGDSLIYDATRISYVVTLEPDTSNFFVLEYVRDSLKKSSGNIEYYVERYERKKTSPYWTPIWTTVYEYNNQRLISVRNNLVTIELSFPIVLNKSWDASAYDSRDSSVFTYTRLNLDTFIGAVKYDNNVVILRESAKTLIEQRLHQQYVAETVGVTYEVQQDLKFVDNSVDPSFGKDSIISGTFFERRLLKRVGK